MRDEVSDNVVQMCGFRSQFRYGFDSLGAR